MLVSVALLSLVFAPLKTWPIAYFALVPWVLALRLELRPRLLLLLGWCSGLVFWAINVYWLSWVTLIGYAASVVYLSLYWLIAAIILRAAMRQRRPMWLVLPVVWVALEYARAFVISGFPWFYLAHSQYDRTTLIQIADITGQYGLSFFIAMANGVIVDLLLAWANVDSLSRRRWLRVLGGALCTLALTGVLIGYGSWRLGQQTTSPGPVIGVVQQAVPISLSGKAATQEKILADHIAASMKFVGTDCDIVVWPETMLPMAVNAEMLNVDIPALSSAKLRALVATFIGWSEVEQRNDDNLRNFLDLIINGNEKYRGIASHAEMMGDLSRQLGCPVLAGGSSVHANPDPIDQDDLWLTRNSALWFDGAAKSSDIYSKMHLVPFSEYVPFKSDWLWLYRVLRKCVPEVMAQLDPGELREPFELTRGGRTWRIVSPICYEGTFARVCRRMVMDGGLKRADVLVNMSNDGWFVYQVGDGAYKASFEHRQHLAHYCFRAVELRVPVVRAVNTGISGLIASSGRIVETLQRYDAETMVSGSLLLGGRAKGKAKDFAGQSGARVLVDSRVTVYSLIGDVFAQALSVVAVGIIGLLIWRRKASEPFNVVSRTKKELK